MIMGFGNLMLLPLRVEYLANPRFGLHLNEGDIALLVSVIPNVARLVLNPFWGSLFDRLNFFWIRVAINLTFVLAILSFFFTESMLGLMLGAVTFGMATAGGEIAWNLWVTKFAPAERVADYMAVHTFFTGIRGILAPITAFMLLEYYQITTVGWIATAMILISSLMLIPEARRR